MKVHLLCAWTQTKAHLTDRHENTVNKVEQSCWRLLQIAALLTATHQLDQVPGCCSPPLRMKRVPLPVRETLVSLLLSKGSAAMKGAHVTYGDKSCPTQAILGTRVLAHSVLIFLHILPQNNPVCHLHSLTLCLLMTPISAQISFLVQDRFMALLHGCHASVQIFFNHVASFFWASSQQPLSSSN